MKVVRAEVVESTPDNNGNFVERMLAAIEDNGSNPNSCLQGSDGPLHLSALLMELFLAGMLVYIASKICFQFLVTIIVTYFLFSLFLHYTFILIHRYRNHSYNDGMDSFVFVNR